MSFINKYYVTSVRYFLLHDVTYKQKMPLSNVKFSSTMKACCKHLVLIYMMSHQVILHMCDIKKWQYDIGKKATSCDKTYYANCFINPKLIVNFYWHGEQKM